MTDLWVLDKVVFDFVFLAAIIQSLLGSGKFRVLTASDTKGGHWRSARHLELLSSPQMKRQEFTICEEPGTGKTTLGAVISSGSLLHIHDEDSMDTSTLQMALIGYQAERYKIEEKIAEIRAQLRSWRSRQASSSFSKGDQGMPRANLDPDIMALPISRQAKYQKQWKRDGRCTQCGKQRPPDSAVYCSGCHAKAQGQGQRVGAPLEQRKEAQSREYQLSGVGSRRMNVSSISGGNAGSNTGKHLRSRGFRRNAQNSQTF